MKLNLWHAAIPVVALVAGCAAAVAAPPNWWNADWPYRARIACETGEGDVAWVRIHLAGRTTRDGSDLRLVDPDGSLRSFEILHHDPQLSTLIQFRVPSDQALRTWLYFGNTSAQRINTLNPAFENWQERWEAWKQAQSERQKLVQKRQMLQDELIRLRRRRDRARRSGGDTTRLVQRIADFEKQLEASVVPDAEPAPNKPKAWYPRRGVVLRVYRKAQQTHPKTLTELRKLIRRSAPEGAAFCRGIADGFNRFGPSDHYVSMYDGYLRIDQTGWYEFCTVSDDGSWVRVNNRDVVAWPGAHGWGGAEHGEKSGRTKLSEGAVRVQYYHEEGSGGQMAFLGWRPPGQERFWGIPPEQWLSVRTARAAGYQARDKPLMAVPLTRVVNTYWVRDSDDRQATLVEFRDRSRSQAGKVVKAQWSFGDGLEAEGRRLRHVYFRTGRPEVTLTVTDAAGNSDSATCRPNVFYVDVRTRYFRFGNPRQYAEVAAGYDVERMAREDLQLYAEFWGYLEKWGEHVRAVAALIRRFPDCPAIPHLAASAAQGCMQPGAYDPQRAEELYRLTLPHVEDPLERAEMDLRLAEVLAWGLDDTARARTLLNALATAAATHPSPDAPRIHRAAAIGLGDTALLAGDYAEAERLYRQAEGLGGRSSDQPEVLARIGSYGYTVLDLLARGEFDWARTALDRWESEFPAQKLEGYTSFLRGKVLYVQHPGPLALRYLELAERVSPRAVHVPEAVWLRANCLFELQRYPEALAGFERIVSDFTQSEYYEQALDKIAACRSKLEGLAPTDGGAP
jgi:tetratricopeptide (TPR) repeat protein